jgi:hypothetical protein
LDNIGRVVSCTSFVLLDVLLSAIIRGMTEFRILAFWRGTYITGQNSWIEEQLPVVSDGRSNQSRRGNH